jgi:hypothetical protein
MCVRPCRVARGDDTDEHALLAPAAAAHGVHAVPRAPAQCQKQVCRGMALVHRNRRLAVAGAGV